MLHNSSRLIATFVATLLLISPARALTIDLDWDTSSVFYTNTTARDAIQQAADDLSYWITSPLGQINQNTWSRDSTTISNQTLSSDYDWTFNYTDGVGNQVTINPSLPANTVRFAVFGENLGGSQLGEGGSAGIGFQSQYGISYSGAINQANLQTQFTEVNNWHMGSNAAGGEYDRGGGPVISTLSGVLNINFGGGNTASAPYAIPYGPAYGTLSLDTSGTDWHYDHTIPVVGGRNDLYSVALHEMLHALGIGGSETWDSFANGADWTGSHVIAENGTGNDLLDADGAHIENNVMSTSVVDGAMQEVVMDPNITRGTRKYLTALDLAFLRDLNYTTRAIPTFSSPGDFNGDGTVDLADYTLWRNNLGAGTEAAINNNGNGGGITTADYTFWKDNYGATYSVVAIGSSAQVPEPSTAGLLVLLGLLAGRSIGAGARK